MGMDGHSSPMLSPLRKGNGIERGEIVIHLFFPGGGEGSWGQLQVYTIYKYDCETFPHALMYLNH